MRQHALREHHDDLLQVVLGLLAQVRRRVLKLVGLREQHVPGRQLRVEAQQHILLVPRAEHVRNDRPERAVRHVVRKVEVCQPLSRPADPQLPGLVEVAVVRFVRVLTLLGCLGLAVNLFLENFELHDAPAKHLLAHAFADLVAENGVLAQLQVDPERLGRQF